MDKADGGLGRVGGKAERRPMQEWEGHEKLTQQTEKLNFTEVLRSL